MIFPIIEILDSIQGEGSWLGIPATFIRFAGCNLRCEWCDTIESWNSGNELDVESIVSKVNYKTVILTDGEPMLYNLEGLIKVLRHKCSNIVDFKIAIETNGTEEINFDINWVVCSPKHDSNYENET